MICGLSTSSTVASVALFNGDRIVASARNVHQKLHAERLFELIDECFAAAGVTRADLSMLACDVGPGSFTGVRVGVAAATGIAMGLAGMPGSAQVRCVGVHALAALTTRSGAEAERTLAAVDGQKGQVFFVQADPSRLPARYEVQVEERARYVEIARAARSAGGVLVGDLHEALGFAEGEFVRGAVDAELICRFGARVAEGTGASFGCEGFVASVNPSIALVPIYGRGADATLLSDRGARR